MVKIAPSVMCADFLDLERNIRDMERAAVDFFHIDIMDGHFVPNLTLNLDIVRLLKSISKTPLDVHLMVENPENYISRLGELGVEYVSFHIETVRYPFRLIREIKGKGMKAGIALNPVTAVESIQYVIGEAEFVLVMTVEPGFAGQSFIPEMLEKIALVKKTIDSKKMNIQIEVDGNISEQTGKLCVERGADILVAGTSSVFKKGVDLFSACVDFKKLMNETII